MRVGPEAFMILAAVLFALGLYGAVSKKSAVMVLMSLELMAVSVNLNMVAFSSYLHNATGQVFVFFVMTIAAAEAALGLAILVNLFKNLESINVDDVNHLKG